MFELHQLRCFAAVAEELHFGRAAERLHMTQPPLSRQLRLLEDAVGARLLDRTSRRVSLTPAGRVFLERARELLRLAEDGALAARVAASGQAGHLSLGFTAGSAVDLLPGLLREFHACSPGVSLDLKEMVTTGLLQRLEQGQAHACLIRPLAAAQGYEQLTMARDTLVAALPAGHPLARRPCVDIRDFEGQPFIGYAADDARYYFDIAARVFSLHGVTPALAHSVSQPQTMVSLVRAGLGMALVAGWVRRHAVSADVVFLPLSSVHPVPELEIRLAWRADRMTPVLDRFIAAARRLAEQGGGAAGNPAMRQGPLDIS